MAVYLFMCVDGCRFLWNIRGGGNLELQFALWHTIWVYMASCGFISYGCIWPYTVVYGCILYGRVLLCMVVYGSMWLRIAGCGCLSPYMTMYCCTRLHMVVYGCISLHMAVTRPWGAKTAWLIVHMRVYARICVYIWLYMRVYVRTCVYMCI